MKASFAPLLFVSIALSQTEAHRPRSNAAWNAFYAQQTSLRRRGTAALKREQARSGADLCKKAEAGGDASIGRCLAAEDKKTEQDYSAYVHVIGALLRLPVPGVPPTKSERLAFDTGESSWQNYREQGCRSVSSQYEGGSEAQMAYPNCLLAVTWTHMNELAKLYSDLWH